MKLFLLTNHKVVVFLMFVTVWTEFILPKQYKNSDFVFWILCVVLLTWFYFAYKVLSKLDTTTAERFKIPFYISLCLLSVGLTCDWLLGIDTGHFGNLHIGFWKGVCYAFLVFVIAKMLLQVEGEQIASLKGFYTLGLIFVLPIGAWWIHQRLQKVASADSGQPGVRQAL